MIHTCGLPRRGFFKLGAGLIGRGTCSVRSRLSANRIAAEPLDTQLPSRGEFVVRGGQILSMAPSIGDLAIGDVHVRDGSIVAVGNNLSAPGAQVIDARDMIVMPGFVDTHWHLWSTALRLIVRADDPENN